jgi:hypothetical protein
MPHRHGHRFLLPAWVRRAVYAIGAACLLSGSVWLYMHDFVRIESEFGQEHSTLEHPLLVMHGAAAAAATWLFGLLWLVHIRRGWHARKNRRSGGTMVALMVGLCVTGLGLYYCGDETARAWISSAHWIAGLIAGLWLPIHIWRGRRAIRTISAPAARAGLQ